MSRKELIELVSKIMNCEGSESEIDKMIEVLKENVMNPAVINLIYSEDNTPEEVVDKALAYKPIIL